MYTNERNRIVIWAVLAIVIVVNLAALWLNWYQRIVWADKVIHPASIGILTLMGGLWLYDRSLTGANDHGGLLVSVLTGLGLGLGALWEIGEWSFDLFASSNMIKGKFDTITDMIVDTFGAFVAALIALALVRAYESRGRRRAAQ